LFSVNPITAHGGMWISGKPYCLAAIGGLLMYLFPYYSCIVYLFWTWKLSQALIPFPIVFIATNYWDMASVLLIGFFRSIPHLFTGEVASKHAAESNEELASIRPRKIIIMLKSFGYYTCNCLAPHTIGLYHNYLMYFGIDKNELKNWYKPDKYFFIGLIMSLVTIYLLFTHRTQPVTLGLVWFYGNIAMFSNLVTMNQPITNRYCYLPMIGLMVSLTSVLQHIPHALYVVAGAYFIRYWWIRVMFKSEYWSVEFHCMDEPESPYVWLNRAAHCFENRNLHGSLANLNKGLLLRPNDWKLQFNKTQVLLLMGQEQTARESFAAQLKMTIYGREKEMEFYNNMLKTILDEVAEARKKSSVINFDLARFGFIR